MSATSKKLIWTGFFDKPGSPKLKVKICGPFGKCVELDAILDTGFTGFISMPQKGALPLGLNLYGTVSIELADGNKVTRLTASGLIEVLGEEKAGVVILEPNSKDVLLGMDFLSAFGKALFLSKEKIFLADADIFHDGVDWWMKRVMKWLSLASIPTFTQDEPAPPVTEGKHAKKPASVATGQSAGRGGKAKHRRIYDSKFHGF